MLYMYIYILLPFLLVLSSILVFTQLDIKDLPVSQNLLHSFQLKQCHRKNPNKTDIET